MADTPFGDLNKDVLYQIIEDKDKTKLAAAGGAEGIMKTLECDPDKGIAPDSVQRRLKLFGPNKLPESEPVTFFGLVVEALGDTMLQILIGAAIVSLILGLTVPDPKTGVIDYATGWIEGAAILMSVAVVTFVTAWNDYSKAQKFAELNEETARKEVVVVRDGHRIRIDISEVVVGDLLRVEYGDILGADGLYISGEDIICDESAQTGESEPIHKGADTDPFFLAGAMVTEGGGNILITGVGESSCKGKLSAALQVEKQETPLQEKLGDMANDIGKFGLGAAIITFATLSIKELYYIFALGTHAFHIKPFLDFLIVAVTIVVVAIPEGLPLAVTISLAYSMQMMQKDNCLVRVLSACETMGGATTICSDKTGTLTTNQMSVVRGFVAGTKFDLTPPSSFDFAALPKDVVATLCESLSLNSTAEEKITDEGKKVWDGNKTEQGLLRFVAGPLGFDYAECRSSFTRETKKQWPFNSAKKRMTTMVIKGGKGLLHIKGAPEIILEECGAYLDSNGRTAPLDMDMKNTMLASIEAMAKEGNRVLLIALAKIPVSSIPAEEPTADSFTCVGMLGISDPVRDEVPGAVKNCQESGILVRMVTGDNMLTACSIAKQCGIYEEGKGIAMEGKDFRAQVAEIRESGDAAAVKEIVNRLQVLARSSPEDKQILAKLLQDNGEVVAVTGDGTNDGPALKMANVGFSMNTGTDVAKAASDIVLMDDNFVSVVKAVMWGRNVNDNIKKFIQFQVTVNIVGVAITFIGAAFDPSNESPLSPVQLLWLNLIMDTLAALALATEQPDEHSLLQRTPVCKDASLITRRMWVNIFSHAIFQLVLLLWLLNYGAEFLGCEHKSLRHMTIYFNTFIITQIWNEFNARKLHGEKNVFEGFMEKSKPHLFVTIVMVLFQIAAVEFGGSFMHTTPLSFGDWVFCTVVGALCLPYGFLINCIPGLEGKQLTREETIAATLKAVQEEKAHEDEIHDHHLHRKDTAGHILKQPGSVIHARKSSYVPPSAE